jgi:RhtB (resistance to homoserine/threonine) family protein
MEYVVLIGTVALIHLLGAMSPGPDLILCIRNSLTYSRRIGRWTALGFGLGLAVHIAYSLLGLAVIISQSILLFNTIKLLGAAYLVYIGFKSLFSKANHVDVGEPIKKEEISSFAAVKMGFLTNVLNPKVTLFFLSLFTLVISPDTPASIMAILSLVMIVDTILWFSFVATALTHKRIGVLFERYQGFFNKTFGGLLIALGVKVAVSER